MKGDSTKRVTAAPKEKGSSMKATQDIKEREEGTAGTLCSHHSGTDQLTLMALDAFDHPSPSPP
ncbi:hypothetical protein Cni_G24402 [Canna indica]|uniref:Uncharacterized protein n=1 Tax=Canna indica TaxID=4628 RepID=A0AAQ3QK23_9LILI|nr:hypothetical protein Cni_G24402 [Canna indica]